MGLKRQFGYDFQVWAISKAKCKSYSWKIKMGKFGRFFECSLIYNYVLYQRKNCHREPLLKLHVHVFLKKAENGYMSQHFTV